MKDYLKARAAYQAALAIDENNEDAREGYYNCVVHHGEPVEEARERALQDPEVQDILRFDVYGRAMP